MESEDGMRGGWMARVMWAALVLARVLGSGNVTRCAHRPIEQARSPDPNTLNTSTLTYHSRSRDTKCGRRPLSRRDWARDVRSQMDGAMPPPFDRRPLRENLERILTAQLSNLGRSRL